MRTQWNQIDEPRCGINVTSNETCVLQQTEICEEKKIIKKKEREHCTYVLDEATRSRSMLLLIVFIVVGMCSVMAVGGVCIECEITPAMNVGV